MSDELQRLALTGWPVEADARVVSVTKAGDRAEVAILVNDYEYWEYFARHPGGRWTGTVSANAPVEDWADPTLVRWDV